MTGQKPFSLTNQSFCYSVVMDLGMSDVQYKMDLIQNISYLLLNMAKEMLWFGDILVVTIWVPYIA